jgi:uncharacterized protein YndB with AHSA1/START domain
MSQHKLIYGGFRLERVYDASAERVFAAWTDPATKARWFIGPDGWTAVRRELDARPGGREVLHGRFADGKETLYDVTFHEVVPNRRLVFVYDMHVNQVQLSVSLATIELEKLGAKTRLVFNEQAVYLNGEDGNASREQGTGWLLEKVGALFE